MTATAFWRRLDVPGHDAAWLAPHGNGHLLHGTAVFRSDDGPAALRYAVLVDARWRTRRARVTGTTADGRVDVRFRADGHGRWRVDGEPRPDLNGCLDVDFGFTPATNLLPLRRLALAPDEAADVRAAWLTLAPLAVQPLAQRYEAVAPGRVCYSSNASPSRFLLAHDAAGFVRDYPGLWTAQP